MTAKVTPLTFPPDRRAGVHESSVLDGVLIGADGQLFDDDDEPIAWPVALAGDKGYIAPTGSTTTCWTWASRR